MRVILNIYATKHPDCDKIFAQLSGNRFNYNECGGHEVAHYRLRCWCEKWERSRRIRVFKVCG